MEENNTKKEEMMGVLIKIWNWLRLNLVSVFGIIHGVLKVIKELLTAIINFLFPLIPNAVFQAVILKIREIVNIVDEWVEKIKNLILPKIS